ncbi:MAG TPA: class I SAM-dependent methyltransferase [Solirubrobacteraceae bacterium]|jgi:SAM-dependent methyltransferase
MATEARDLPDGPDQPWRDPVDGTLETYEARASLYAAHDRGRHAAFVAFLDTFAALAGDGCVLELGSGPGRDADYLEGKGLRVIRTDAAASFVEMMRAAGHDARQLDVRTDDFGGPHNAVLADAVLLHLTRRQLEDVLRRLRAAIRDGGLLAFTVKQGTGEGWTTEKLGRPRYFVYWQEDALREVLSRTGWTVSSLEHSAGPTDDWLQVIAR